jgi:7-cyano-7-deazaguanine reductase
VLRAPPRAAHGGGGVPGADTGADHGADHGAGLTAARPAAETGAIMPTQPSRQLETFPNPSRGRDYEVHFECPEFTCVCPKTGQPDFATLSISYVPDALCVELKSLKLYLWSFRDEGHFHEAVTNRILDDLVALLAPRQMRVEGEFKVRGGIQTTIVAEHP